MLYALLITGLINLVWAIVLIALSELNHRSATLRLDHIVDRLDILCRLHHEMTHGQQLGSPEQQELFDAAKQALGQLAAQRYDSDTEEFTRPPHRSEQRLERAIETIDPVPDWLKAA